MHHGEFRVVNFSMFERATLDVHIIFSSTYFYHLLPAPHMMYVCVCTTATVTGVLIFFLL